jgi:hypothetical protein
MVGIGMGYGLSMESTEELKKCFLEKQDKNSRVVDIFLEKASSIEPESSSGASNNNKQVAQGFLSSVYEFFGNFKDCAPLRDTILSFIMSKITNYAVKGIAYAVGGFIGVLVKGAYDAYKIISEINHFHEIESTLPVNYTELGSTIGRIVSIAQNIAMKKRFK